MKRLLTDTLPYSAIQLLRRERLERVMSVGEEDLDLPAEEQEERASPGFARYHRNDYYKWMVSRYLWVAPLIRNKRWLDVGTGLGWGPFLLDGIASQTVAIDADAEAIGFAQTHWAVAHTRYAACFLQDLCDTEIFDVISAFELIEHLDVSTARALIRDCSSRLRGRGWLVMSSYFPKSELRAATGRVGNPYHLHVYSRREIASLLKEGGFKEPRFLDERLLITRAL